MAQRMHSTWRVNCVDVAGEHGCSLHLKHLDRCSDYFIATRIKRGQPFPNKTTIIFLRVRGHIVSGITHVCQRSFITWPGQYPSERQKCLWVFLGTPVSHLSKHLSALVDIIATLLVSTRKTIKELKDMASSRLLSHPDVQLLLCAVLLLFIIYVSVMCTCFGTLSFRKVS